jgi:hypothetical protein
MSVVTSRLGRRYTGKPRERNVDVTSLSIARIMLILKAEFFLRTTGSLSRSAENATSRCASIAASRLARACEMESYAVLPSARRSAGLALSAAEIMASTVRPASPLTIKLPSAIARRTAPARRVLINVHRRGAHQAAAEIGGGWTGFDDNEVDSEGRDLLSDGFDEAFDAPFGCVIQAEVRVCDLAAFG